MYAHWMPWQKQYDETEVLNRAIDAFWKHGYAATSINDLVEATGIHRGSLYAAYKDKRTLFIHAYEKYDIQYRRDFLAKMAREYPPRDCIIETFRLVAGTVDRKGCLIVNTALELAPHDPEIERMVKHSLGGVETFLRHRIEEGQQDGSIPSDVPAATTASALLGMLLGLRVLSRSSPDAATMDAIVDRAESLLS